MMDVEEFCELVSVLCLSSSAAASSFRPTISAIDWSAWVGLERNFAFRAAICADSLMHLSFGHYFSLSIVWMVYGY
jgi:hypothetical protein